MPDNFDLKKFLKESKALENLNPSFKSLNEGEAAYEYEEGEEAEKKKMNKEAMKKQIKDMIVAELDLNINKSANNSDYGFLSEEDEELEEAKKKDKEEDVEDVEVTDTEIEDIPAEDEMPAEDVSATDGGLEDIAADMKGTEADLMDNLMKAFQIAKGMNNEKLETQVGNTLKFFVSEYIGGGEQ
jgi:hypothetical protein